ncbi:sulfur carrier protein ThiS [Calidifontibacter sp. DB0510]|uniref:Sulfur carrier protein ThiS n=1 Tax=Metallococcus carri TaxID=1656884 RepID=A0A967EG84_9MICO|nr:sulfur carrier protein ThiS [Metallococcus carri]NHN57331.1 sulfur carrier protein ThiS [Metallococcus carri]NOP38064.1 sulfur carrier protein ThiS [Calidifontibacter sp. DB2511S]
MNLTINNEPRELRAGMTCRELVSDLTGRVVTEEGRAEGGGPLGVALAVDGSVVPRSLWATTELADGQQVELVTAVQGG